jgi:hypothetical protein
MKSYQIEDLIITLNMEGAREFSKVSFPIRYGRFSEIQTPDTVFQFNLNGEIKYLQGRSPNWPNPAEWLKRTAGNDWVYYSAGDYQGVYDLFGEYYFPCFSYPSNPILTDHPLEKEGVKSTIYSWKSMQKGLRKLVKRDWPKDLNDFLIRVIEYDDEALSRKSERLHHLIGGPVTVLPPDARHVDYEVIPIIIADGCLYNCGFCGVKSGQGFSSRDPKDIMEQIHHLKGFYGHDLRNYNAIFLGQHDALCAGQDLLEFTAQRAYETFDLEHSYLKGAWLYLFGSIDSFIRSEDKLFDSLSRLPFYTCINIGLESADLGTLAALKKPVTVEKVREAFDRMLEINRKYEKIEITANFVFGSELSEDHLISSLELLRKQRDPSLSKGAIYLSPLMREGDRNKGIKRDLLRKFYKVKAQSPFPTFLYLIQRL